MVSLITGLSVLVISFLLGSIPFGLIIGKVFYGIDIRTQGSGNIGTTNAMRSMGKKAGGAVFALDFLKGVAAGIVALLLTRGGLVSTGCFTVDECLALAFFGSVFGHIYTPWLGFHGGKGIAVAVGSLFVVFGWAGALIELAIFGFLVWRTRYVSVGSIVAAALCPFFSLYFFWGDWIAWLIMAVASFAVVFAHRENISRLRAGKERKIGA